jgi:hypothetical protein
MCVFILSSAKEGPKPSGGDPLHMTRTDFAAHQTVLESKTDKTDGIVKSPLASARAPRFDASVMLQPEDGVEDGTYVCCVVLCWRDGVYAVDYYAELEVRRCVWTAVSTKMCIVLFSRVWEWMYVVVMMHSLLLSISSPQPHSRC